MDLAWSKPHVDTFVIVSGDSDFSPLVSKLKENGKHVIGLGMKGSTSELLRDNCDEFIYYEDLERQDQNDQQLATHLYVDLPEREREVYSLLIEACNALRRENHEVLFASMIKDTMKRKKPSFDESYYGYRSFTHLLEEADNAAVVDIERNPKSGTYVVTRFYGERAPAGKGPADKEKEKDKERDKDRAALPAPPRRWRAVRPGREVGGRSEGRRDRVPAVRDRPESDPGGRERENRPTARSSPRTPGDATPNLSTSRRYPPNRAIRQGALVTWRKTSSTPVTTIRKADRRRVVTSRRISSTTPRSSRPPR